MACAYLNSGAFMACRAGSIGSAGMVSGELGRPGDARFMAGGAAGGPSGVSGRQVLRRSGCRGRRRGSRRRWCSGCGSGRLGGRRWRASTAGHQKGHHENSDTQKECTFPDEAFIHVSV